MISDTKSAVYGVGGGVAVAAALHFYSRAGAMGKAVTETLWTEGYLFPGNAVEAGQQSSALRKAFARQPYNWILWPVIGFFIAGFLTANANYNEEGTKKVRHTNPFGSL